MSLDTSSFTAQEHDNKLDLTAEQASETISQITRNSQGNRKPVKEYFESLPEPLRKELLRNRNYRWVKTAVYGFGG